MGERDKKGRKKGAPHAEATYRLKYLSESSGAEAARYLHDLNFTAMDVYEDEQGIGVEIEMAGVDPHDLSVIVEDGKLVIEGVKKEPAAKGKVHAFHCAERSFGPFKRSFMISSAIDHQNIQASYANGILVLRLPKVTEKRKHTHCIKVRIDE